MTEETEELWKAMFQITGVLKEMAQDISRLYDLVDKITATLVQQRQHIDELQVRHSLIGAAKNTIQDCGDPKCFVCHPVSMGCHVENEVCTQCHPNPNEATTPPLACKVHVEDTPSKCAMDGFEYVITPNGVSVVPKVKP